MIDDIIIPAQDLIKSHLDEEKLNKLVVSNFKGTKGFQVILERLIADSMLGLLLKKDDTTYTFTFDHSQSMMIGFVHVDQKKWRRLSIESILQEAVELYKSKGYEADVETINDICGKLYIKYPRP